MTGIDVTFFNLRLWLHIIMVLVVGSLVTGSPEAKRIGPYDYPFVNELAATVVGTPSDYEADDLPDLEVGSNVYLGKVKIFPEREVPSVLWFQGYGLDYGLVYQKQKRAPVVFIIAGTGAGFSSDKNQLLARALHRAGFHVISIASPTFSNFMINASKTGVPGRMKDDARDIYRAMQAVLDDIGDRIEPTGYSVTGYSLGAINSAFVGALDQEKRVFNFDKVLMINPPVSLFNSVNILDQMLDDNMEKGAEDVSRFLQQAFTQFGALYRQSDSLDLSGDFIYRGFQAFEPRNRELEILIGLSFRFSSANISFISDVMTDTGYIVPKGTKLTSTTPLGDYMDVSMNRNFVDYIENIYMPYFQRSEPDYTLERAANEESLHAIEDYLRTTPNIGLMHNADDIILKRGELKWLEGVMGERSVIFPTGGHCGNMAQHEFVDYLTQFFSE